jgi:hypothetical protein
MLSEAGVTTTYISRPGAIGKKLYLAAEALGLGATE